MCGDQGKEPPKKYFEENIGSPYKVKLPKFAPRLFSIKENNAKLI
jgi:hypothetical protein